ncbi:MAG: LysR family transcriptional regulator, partial [Treponema sp.]|nr:LysR family transcriptional regulator [Treponema sp.]
MNFYELKAFLTLTRELHFAKTAEEINISPSALSRIISRLEEETGTILIDRSNRSVNLTQNGKLFAEFARETLEKQNELEKAFKGEKDKISGTLNVYASVTA